LNEKDRDEYPISYGTVRMSNCLLDPQPVSETVVEGSGTADLEPSSFAKASADAVDSQLAVSDAIDRLASFERYGWRSAPIESNIQGLGPMADVANKYAQNVAGKFYVDDQCIDCDLCRETAPANFTRDDDGGHSYVFKQPTTPEEDALCKEAMEGCPVEAIGSDGE
jgi:ferredoxin